MATQYFAAIPARYDGDKPFKIGETLTLYEAAMALADRHPYERFFEVDKENVEDLIGMLQLGLSQSTSRISGKPQRSRAQARQRVQATWDIYCTLRDKIERGKIQPVRKSYDQAGNLHPGRTIIKTCDVIALATERGDQSKYLEPLLSRVDAHQGDEKNTPTKASKKRASPVRDRAARALVEIYPGGIPPMDEESNQVLVGRVEDWLKSNKLKTVSEATILRAAGRHR